MTNKCNPLQTMAHHIMECPHPECTHGIKFHTETVAGVYPCPCHACRVKLSWQTPIGTFNRPTLSLNTPPEQRQGT